MDYSNLPNDPDHPPGTSPWQSSPGPTRSGFERPERDSRSSSPTPANTSATHGPPTTESSAADLSTPEPQFREDYASPEQEPPSPSLLEDAPIRNGRGSIRTNPSNIPEMRFQEAPLTEEELRQRQLQQQRQQERYQQALHAQHTARGPNRYHQTGRGQRQPPQYRMTAKITGLERTGKKDPSIRFDVHVRKCRMVA